MSSKSTLQDVKALAESLGISTKGKSKKELLGEIDMVYQMGGADETELLKLLRSQEDLNRTLMGLIEELDARVQTLEGKPSEKKKRRWFR